MPPKALLLSISVNRALKSLCRAHQNYTGKESKTGKAADPNLRELPTQKTESDEGGALESGENPIRRQGPRLKIERSVCRHS